MSDLKGIGNTQGVVMINTQNQKDPRKRRQLSKHVKASPVENVEPSLSLDLPPSTRMQLEEDIALLNEIGASLPPALIFSIVDQTDTIMVRMMDRETNEVLQQIPCEDFMTIADRVRENGDSLTQHPGQWVELNA